MSGDLAAGADAGALGRLTLEPPSLDGEGAPDRADRDLTDGAEPPIVEDLQSLEARRAPRRLSHGSGLAAEWEGWVGSGAMSATDRFKPYAPDVRSLWAAWWRGKVLKPGRAAEGREQILQGGRSLVAIPGPVGPAAGGAGVGVLRIPEQDQVVDEEGEWGGAADGARSLALRIGAAEGPSVTVERATAKYRHVIEFKSDDHRVLTSHALGEDGQWHTFMTAHYRRKM